MPAKKQSTQTTKPIKLPEGVTVEELVEYYNTAKAEYQPAFRKMRLLDAFDRGKMWTALKGIFPSYQILPNTNHVSKTKMMVLANLYCVTKSAKLLPTIEEDKQAIEDLNTWLEHIWAVENVGFYQMQAGSRAALLNYGITQVGLKGKGDGIELSNVDPMQFMRDPFAETLEEAAYCITWFTVHWRRLANMPQYKDAKKLIKEGTSSAEATPVNRLLDKQESNVGGSREHYRTVYIYWIVDEDGEYHEIHLMDNEVPIFVKESLKPAMFPFAELYCCLPEGDLIGNSMAAKILPNSMAYNLNNAMMLTAEYRNQHPPKFINAQSGINVASFEKNGDKAGYTFIVAGDATKAVHYHKFPEPSKNAVGINASLALDMKDVTGIDDRYTGRDSGSILTTGGIESMLNQVTMIDAPKVANYEAYTEQLTKIILKMMIRHGAKRTYLIRSPQTDAMKSISIDFPKINNDILLNYDVSISSELPKNKMRIATMATQILEKQMQYRSAGMEVDWITPEEWLSYQDIPFREAMLKRMGLQRTKNMQEMVAEILFTFSALTKGNGTEPGMSPDEAMIAVAAQMQANQDVNNTNNEPELPIAAEAPPRPRGMGGIPNA